MELKSILTGIEGLKVRGDLDLSIKKLESDSRAVKKGDLFVAIKGFDTDVVDHRSMNPLPQSKMEQLLYLHKPIPARNN